MSQNSPLREAAPVVAALSRLVAEHGSLTMPIIQLDWIYESLLRLSFHDQPGAFDAWIEAIAPASILITTGMQAENTQTRKVTFPFAGIEIQIYEYMTPSSEEVAS